MKIFNVIFVSRDDCCSDSEITVKSFKNKEDAVKCLNDATNKYADECGIDFSNEDNDGMFNTDYKEQTIFFNYVGGDWIYKIDVVETELN